MAMKAEKHTICPAMIGACEAILASTAQSHCCCMVSADLLTSKQPDLSHKVVTEVTEQQPQSMATGPHDMSRPKQPIGASHIVKGSELAVS